MPETIPFSGTRSSANRLPPPSREPEDQRAFASITAVEVSRENLEAQFRAKYGEPACAGWRPQLSYRAGYFTPDDYYEALVNNLVKENTPWLDVGCGRDLFPNNRALGRVLSARSGHVVGIDPDDNLDSNPDLHVRVKSPIETFHSPILFPLVTMRMVAEHITHPAETLQTLARLTAPGGKVVVYTVHRWSPAAIAAWLVPFSWHHPIKRLLWGCEERDTFPVAYLMNTRYQLRRAFQNAGFRECSFTHLADCRTFARSRWLHRLELALWKGLKTLHLSYPETCLLGVYERLVEPASCRDKGDER